MKLTVKQLVPGGQGISKISDKKSPHFGQVIFLWNALPGEAVSDYQIATKKSNYLEGIVTKLDTRSPHRVKSSDPCFLSTSPWQIMDFAYELEQKRLLVAESFRQAKLTLPEGIEIEPTITDGTEWHYRNKMEYALYWDNYAEKIKLAFHGRGTHRKIPIITSSIERPEILAKAQAIIDELNKNHDEARKYQSLLLRANQRGEVSGGLYGNHHPHPTFPALTDIILGHEYTYSPNGFFQINLPVYELALKEIVKEISTDKVLDLYAGVGTIGLSVARDKDLTLVECNADAFRELQNNCVGTSAQPILAKSESALDYLEKSQTVILDPPRSGCHHNLLEKLLEITPEKIIYLSCNPATQARDLKTLAAQYSISRVVPFNFFPKTTHIENLAILTRKS